MRYKFSLLELATEMDNASKFVNYGILHSKIAVSVVEFPKTSNFFTPSEFTRKRVTEIRKLLLIFTIFGWIVPYCNRNADSGVGILYSFRCAILKKFT